MFERQAGGQRRADQHPRRVGPDMRRLIAATAPPGRDIGQGQRLAGQMFGDVGQKRHQRLHFQHPGPQRVDHGHRALTQRRDHAGGADLRGFDQFQRVGPGGIHPAPQHIDRRQAADGAYLHRSVLHDQIAPFQQRQAEIAGDIGLFVIGGGHRSGGQDTGPPAAAQPVKCGTKRAKEPGQP